MIPIIGFLFIYSSDIKIVNSEKVFLSQNAFILLNEFEEKFTKNEFLILKIPDKKTENVLKKLCKNDCTFLDQQFHQHENIFYFISENKGLLKNIVEIALEISPQTEIAGPAFINHLLDKNSVIIGKVIFPIFYFLIAIILYALFKSVSITLTIMIPTITSALISQAAIKFFFKTSDIIISITPLLISILILTTQLHLIFQLINSSSISLAIKEKLRPILYMLITTTLGFFSLVSSPLTIIKNFGILTGTLLIVCFFFSALFLYFLPFNLSLTKNFFSPKKISQIKIPIPFFLSFFIILILILPFLIQNIPIEIDASKYFSKNDQVKEKLASIAKQVGGTPILDIVFPITEFKNEYLGIDKIEKELKELLNLEYLSANKFVSKANYKYQKVDDLPQPYISYLPLYYQTPEVIRELYPIDNFYRLSILGPNISGEDYQDLINKIKNLLDSKNINYEFNGQYFWLIEAQRGLINTILKSFGLTFFAISIFVLIIFRNLKIFFKFIYVNIFPILIILYIFPLTGISINIATVMSFSISIGLMVDSTFHLFVERQKNLTLKEIHQTTILPIFWSNILLAGIFLLFGLIDFLPIRQFGLTMSMLIFLGLFFDIYLLPKLLKFD